MCDLRSVIADNIQRKPNLDEGLAAKIEATPEYAAVRRRMIADLPGLPGEPRILDIGPAMGWELTALRERFPSAEVWGVTLFEEETRAWPLDAIARVCDMHSLGAAGIQAESFDLVYAAHVLEHSPAPIVALDEMATVCKPGGWVEIVMPEPYGVVHLGSERAFRMTDIAEHVFCAGIDTVVTMLRHAGLRFHSYREYAVTAGGKLHYWNRCWRAQRPSSGGVL